MTRHPAVTEYENRISGIPDCFDFLTEGAIRDIAKYAATQTGTTVATETDKFVRAHLKMITEWYDALDALDSDLRSHVVEGALPDWARELLKIEASKIFDANEDLQTAIVKFHYGSSGPRLSADHGYAYPLSSSALRPF